MIRTGAAEAVANALLQLFLLETKPENPIEFVRENLDLNLHTKISELKNDIELAKDTLAQLNAEISEMRKFEIKLVAEEIEVDGENENMAEGDARSESINTEEVDEENKSMTQVEVDEENKSRTIVEDDARSESNNPEGVQNHSENIEIMSKSEENLEQKK